VFTANSVELQRSCKECAKYITKIVANGRIVWGLIVRGFLFKGGGGNCPTFDQIERHRYKPVRFKDST